MFVAPRSKRIVNPPSPDELRALFNYNPDTGQLTWKQKIAYKIHMGQVAGSRTTGGYLRIGYKGNELRVHRIVWALHHGEWPTGDIDHINGCVWDNRIENLRDVSHRVNQTNCKYHRDGKLPGANHRGKGRWRAIMRIDKKAVYLGTFGSELEAHRAYSAKLKQMETENGGP